MRETMQRLGVMGREVIQRQTELEESLRRFYGFAEAHGIEAVGTPPSAKSGDAAAEAKPTGVSAEDARAIAEDTVRALLSSGLTSLTIWSESGGKSSTLYVDPKSGKLMFR